MQWIVRSIFPDEISPAASRIHSAIFSLYPETLLPDISTSTRKGLLRSIGSQAFRSPNMKSGFDRVPHGRPALPPSRIPRTLIAVRLHARGGRGSGPALNGLGTRR